MALRTALLIIDMQCGMLSNTLPDRNNPNAEKHIRALLAHWRAKQRLVVHVRHISRTMGSPFWPGQPGAEFQPELAPEPTEHVVEKNVPDAFINTGLERWLHQRDIKALAIVGVSTNNSVEATARSAGNLGFRTYVVSDATFAFAQCDFAGRPRSAQEVHDMSLANLSSEYATILQSTDLLGAD